MKTIVALAAVAMVSMEALSFSLEGAWQSDREKTLEWNGQNRKVDPDYLARLATVLGSHVLVYGEEKVCQFLMPQEYNYGATKVPIYGGSLGNDRYKVIAENEHGFVVRQTLGDGKDIISMLVFESNDSFYGVALDGEDYGEPGYREYYQRIKLPKPINWQAENCYQP